MIQRTHVLSLFLLAAFSHLALGMMVPKGKGEIKNSRIYDSTAKFFTFSDGTAGLCTGTYLNATTILTAGHCVPSEKSEDPRLLLLKVDKKNNMAGDAAEFGPDEFVGVRYPGFDELENSESALRSASDVGLIIFKTPVHSGPFAILSDANLKQDFLKQIDGPQLFVVGAGSRNFHRLVPRRQALTEIYALLGGILGSTASLFGVDYGWFEVKLPQGYKICEGDSGGPVLAQINGQAVQVGISSQIKLGLGRLLMNPTSECSRNLLASMLDPEKIDWISEQIK